MSRQQRLDLIATAQAMNASGINAGTTGNLSLRSDDGMLITPSRTPYSDLQPEDIVPVSANGSWPQDQTPSSEWRFHRDIYLQRPDAQAIVHAHPVHCSALASLHRSIPAFHYMVAVAGGKDIRCCDYATYGTQELSDLIIAALQERKACLMANHGLVCLESNLPRALALAMEVENLARTYCQALAIGEPVILDDEEMQRVIAKLGGKGSNA
ncbi:MAG: class II aldolase/adducin family protein [Xanthomonadales bacterium]|nr:class II aldolase/adducin family protein [Xanthomonadales bacterium]